MSTTNASGAALQAAEAKLAGDIGLLGTALQTQIADFKAALAAELSAAGVPQSTVDQVTSALGPLDATIQSLTASVAGSDPGPTPTTSSSTSGTTGAPAAPSGGASTS